jgi:glycosyltransferase involved in cell wall biosynthesis
MSAPPLLAITPSDARKPLVFWWGVSSFFGWGIYGLNLMLALASHPDYAPFCAIECAAADIVLDPLRQGQMAAALHPSLDLWSALGAASDPLVELDAPLLIGLGLDLRTASAAHNTHLTGRPTIGVVFLEEATLSPAGRQRADRLALIVAGSSWNERVLRANGIVAATTVLQGVDASLFHPAPKADVFPERFVIFSGGKLEFRKGQDLVLAAFRAFHQRHPEALLLTAWHCPWSHLGVSAASHPGITPPRLGLDGADVMAWAMENGVPAEAVVSVGQAPNIAMPHVIRQADVALFANRAEGGTNLVAMECMACGIPTILSANTGHLDLLKRTGVALPLRAQGKVIRDGVDTTDWGESNVEEMVESLEVVWRDRAAATAMGQRAAMFMQEMTWPTQVGKLIRAIEPLL